MKLELYRDRKKEWRWRIAKRGRIIAASSEGYKRRLGAIKNISRILTLGLVFSGAGVAAQLRFQDQISLK